MAHERTAASTNLRYGSWNSVEECAARARETRGALRSVARRRSTRQSHKITALTVKLLSYAERLRRS